MGKLNEIIEFAFLDHYGLTQLYFRDRTLLDFFAARWVTNHATDLDRRWLRDNQFVRREKATSDYEQFWRFIAEMPWGKLEPAPSPVSRAADAKLQAATLAVLFEPSAKATDTIRSTEMIYRSWPTLLKMAGYAFCDDWCESDLIEPTERAQLEARQLVEDCFASCRLRTQSDRRDLLRSTIERESNSAKRGLLHYLSEFPGIQHGTQGKKAQQIALAFEKWFVDIPNNAADSLEFWMGDKENRYNVEPLHEARLSERFRMAKFTLTNELYDMYDTRHRRRFDDYTRFSPDSMCPAIDLDWYDGWSVSLWLHARMPDEYEWEYACRGEPGRNKAPQPWCCGTEEQLKRYAWYDVNSADKTHPIGKRESNQFGLYDWHNFKSLHAGL